MLLQSQVRGRNRFRFRWSGRVGHPGFARENLAVRAEESCSRRPATTRPPAPSAAACRGQKAGGGPCSVELQRRHLRCFFLRVLMLVKGKQQERHQHLGPPCVDKGPLHEMGKPLNRLEEISTWESYPWSFGGRRQDLSTLHTSLHKKHASPQASTEQCDGSTP